MFSESVLKGHKKPISKLFPTNIVCLIRSKAEEAELSDQDTDQDNQWGQDGD